MTFISIKTFILIAALFSGGLGVLSSLLLTRGTASVPWDIQSWEGKSDPELAYKKTTQRYLRGGLITMGMAFFASGVAAVLDYLS